MKDRLLYILASLIYIVFALLCWLPLTIPAILALPYMLIANSIRKDDSGFAMYKHVFIIMYEIIQDEVILYKLTFKEY